MLTPTVPAAVSPNLSSPRAHARAGTLRKHRGSYLLLLPYLLFLALFGLGPGIYALLLSFADFKMGVPRYFAAGFANYVAAFNDFRFTQTFANMGWFLLVSVPLGIGLVILLALLLDMRPGRTSSVLRLIYFIPGAVTGPALVLLAICMLNPDISPFGPLFKAAGLRSFDDIVYAGSLPYVFTIIGFFSGAGMWIAIQHGALQGVSQEVLEAATLDGCNAWQKALRIKLPFIRPFIVYQTILVFAGNVQLFVEPQLLSSTWVQGNVPGQWAPNQLAYAFAFELGNFGAAAALSLLMLAIGLLGAYLLIRFTGFFRIEA